MANQTVKDAMSVKGTNPQYLVEKIIRYGVVCRLSYHISTQCVLHTFIHNVLDPESTTPSTGRKTALPSRLSCWWTRLWS